MKSNAYEIYYDHLAKVTESKGRPQVKVAIENVGLEFRGFFSLKHPPVVETVLNGRRSGVSLLWDDVEALGSDESDEAVALKTIFDQWIVWRRSVKKNQSSSLSL